jgi:hypothetical protein
VAKKAKVNPKATKATAATAKPRGLQLSAAQWRAYDSAYTAAYKSGEAALTAQYKASNAAAAAKRVAAATARYQAAQIAYRRQAIASAAQSLRKYRLGAATSMQKVAAASHQSASTAAIALFAVSQSLRQAHLAHQNAALVSRVYADFERHLQILGRKQYVAKGEKVFAHDAVMRTLTTAQALGIEQVRFSQAVSTAKAATAYVYKPAAYKAYTSTPAQKAANQVVAKAAQTRIKATAKAAGLAAAEAVTPVKKAPRTAPRPAGLHPLGFMHGFGNPDGDDCLPASVANYLLLDLGVRLTAREYAELVHKLSFDGEIEDALESLSLCPPWNDGAPLLAKYSRVPYNAARVLLVGYDSQKGRHAAVSAGNGNVVSWGEVLPLAETLAEDAVVEEAWDLLWVRHRPL